MKCAHPYLPLCNGVWRGLAKVLYTLVHIVLRVLLTATTFAALPTINNNMVNSAREIHSLMTSLVTLVGRPACFGVGRLFRSSKQQRKLFVSFAISIILCKSTHILYSTLYLVIYERLFLNPP